MNPMLLRVCSSARIATIFTILFFGNRVPVCGARRLANHDHVYLWKHAKIPGDYKARQDSYITPTAEDHSVLGRKVAKGQTVMIGDVRVINEEYIRGKTPNGGWITIGHVDGQGSKYYLVRTSSIHEKRRIEAMADVGMVPTQNWLHAEGYRLRPLHWKHWSYGFTGDKDAVKWSISGMFKDCPDFVTPEESTIVLPMESSGKNKKAGIWSAFSMSPYVMPGCSVLQGQEPVDLTFTMSIGDQVMWTGHTLLEPENFCDIQSGVDQNFEDPVGGEVFLPVRKLSEETPLNHAVALFAISYRCFSIQANGFHKDTGPWRRWEAHLHVTKTVFHLISAAPECAGEWLPFGC